MTTTHRSPSTPEKVLTNILAVLIHDQVHRARGVPAILAPAQIDGKRVTLTVPMALLRDPMPEIGAGGIDLRINEGDLPGTVQVTIAPYGTLGAPDGATIVADRDVLTESGRPSIERPTGMSAAHAARYGDGEQVAERGDDPVLTAIAVGLLNDLARRTEGKGALVPTEVQADGKIVALVRQESLPEPDGQLELRALGDGVIQVSYTPERA